MEVCAKCTQSRGSLLERVSYNEKRFEDRFDDRFCCTNKASRNEDSRRFDKLIVIRMNATREIDEQSSNVNV